MARKRDRIFALSMAALFLFSSVGLSAAVIWQMVQDGKNNGKTETQTVNPNQLAGTKLENFTPVAKIDELQKIDTVVGTGEEVPAGATVTAHYTGAVAATGVIFQSSKDSGQPIPFSLKGVIKGWTEGVPGMKVGGTRRLLIPAALAYAGNPPEGSGIPVNADLVFDVSIVKLGE